MPVKIIPGQMSLSDDFHKPKNQNQDIKTRDITDIKSVRLGQSGVEKDRMYLLFSCQTQLRLSQVVLSRF